MPTPLFALLVLSGAALYFMTPDERTRLAQKVLHAIRTAIRAVTHTSASGGPFEDLLRSRTRWAIVTPLLAAVHVAVFGMMLFDRGAFGDTETLIAWGGNFAPRTTNDEWWRLIGSTFVHGGFLHFAATVIGLVPLGLVLERAIGRLAFASIYLASGLLASLVSLWITSPTSVSFGASGAVFGVYGLLVATLVWAIVHRPEAPIPLSLVKRTAAAAVPFFLYNLLTDDLATGAELAGLATGFVGGLVIARGVTREKPALLRTAAVALTAAVIAIGAAVPLRGIIDVRPEIARIAVLETRLAGAYDAAVGEFKLGRLPPKRLAQVIDRTILPDLLAMRTRLKSLRGVPREQAPLVEAAERYFTLREQSWRRRAEGLLRANIGMLREAERTERAALDILQTFQPAT